MRVRGIPFEKGRIPWNKGMKGEYGGWRRKNSKETRKKIGKALKGKKKSKEWIEHRTGWHHSNKTKKKLRQPKSEKTKKKMRVSQKKRWDRIGRKKRKRCFHPSSRKYKEWRTAVFEYDDYTCWVCGIRGNQIGCYLEAHHLKSWAKYPKLRYKINNGVTLCKECHKLIPKKL